MHRNYSLSQYKPTEILGNGHWGMIDNNVGEIKYVEAEQGTETADTIVHEVLHGIARMMDIPFKTKNYEETVVAQFATGLVTVLKDNPKLVAALVELLKS